jgi:hypothetical protein
MIEEITDTVFDREYVREPRRLLSSYEFRLGVLEQRITIRLYWNISEHKVECEQSHFLCTPAQFGPYTADPPRTNSEVDALRTALEPLTAYYEYAIREGHEPEETWLVPNESFS